MHDLIGKMREWKLAGVIISIEQEVNEELIANLTQFSDDVIDFTE